jgi:lipopolysaccharide/colanic/teichoic acid biosynthesis glycosyltransferase
MAVATGKSVHVARRRDFGGGATRLVDLSLAALLLVTLAPLMVVLAVAILLDSPGPVFYRCRRVGFGGGQFAMLKFRKMRRNAVGPALTAAGDERFTRVGAFLARTKLDELPQLWNVIRGQMSLVGPRPEDPSFVALEPDGYDEILQVRPGITGLSQLAFANEGRLLGKAVDRVEFYERRLLPQKIAIDRLYVARRSIGGDLRILLWTAVAVVARAEVAVDRHSGRLSVRRRPNGFEPAPAATEAVSA